MTKRYWLILITFICVQLLFPIPLIPLLANAGLSEAEVFGYAILISFTVGTIIIGYLGWSSLRKEGDFDVRSKSSAGFTAMWAVIGIFMAFAAQIVANLIQINLFGTEPGSENTEQIVEMALAVPLMAFAVAIFAPVMEEIVFRQVIFGALYRKWGFWIGALGSGFLFAVVHTDFQNILVYLIMGIVFSYLYVKTKRIIVPIIAHAGINGFVMLVQVVFREEIERIMELQEQQALDLQAILLFIGGLM
ncbi:CPBP family intramembrane glutamic endopeptidase [Alteribacter natronophilus]|uniref:CPBP family intramembrane glutamic endopeptidase n=1 Tax=Alteribacter natronophilus TaxID=2583810 RepID=UPI00110E85BA|nr:type II CAAX endopeptidase family protein [Alteribacter natronophilus]TMW70902.1 CPBP family intramembrane metalloprotease [Alteribacter natronophilus]